MEAMVTGRRTMKMVQKVSLMRQLMFLQSGMKNDKHGLSEGSEADACVEETEKVKARVVASREDRDFDL